MGFSLKFLVVGLGSMGKRRIRNLKSLGFSEIAGFDLKVDRLKEAKSEYGIKIFETYEVAMEVFKPNALIISTSPKHHMHYAFDSVSQNIPCFIEASVVEKKKILELSHIAKEKNVIVAPSCTMKYFPGPIKVKELLDASIIGKVLNVNYQTGQYLPDWHPWEDIQDYYVSERDTGGCREIVPFELTWLNSLFGKPKALACVKRKLTSLEIDIDEIYHCLLEYPGKIIANLTIEVVSRPRATRVLTILGSKGKLVFDADENSIRYANLSDPNWKIISLALGNVMPKYINPEEPYEMELASYIEAIKASEQSIFPNNLQSDFANLDILEQLENLS